ncbi:peptidase M16 [Luteitalea sp. TBR-22]|uniref:M16 family metallopeptidase n=1 Tax=Luteitalea sp. TBR-22 TaxID=2802971 RepID=UPI001AF8C2D7|nr:pitrilysin family protein [Luteitalea sp. TBR-22]BCS31323.1 peptidase M16 [Luteitalea sp. TBR-22]
MIVHDTLPNGVRLVTETMPHVRSVSLGVWLARGSRHEVPEEGGIAHFIEHMLFKGTERRTAQQIAEQFDSMGGNLDAFTSKEYAGYYLKVMDEHLPRAFDILSDLVLHPAFPVDEIEREKKVILEEIKMVEDTPDDLVHEWFTELYWPDHPLGRPILGTPDTVASFTQDTLFRYFREAYVGRNLIVSAAGNFSHDELRRMVEGAFGGVTDAGADWQETAPAPRAPRIERVKDLEQSHLVIGTPAFPQAHHDRYPAYLLNVILGGSMSSRLFQTIREQRGLAYAVFSGVSSYRDTGMLSVYAGCAAESVAEVVDLVAQELRTMRTAPVGDDELRRAKDHLKGSLMLSLESTSSRMTHLARQEMYFGRHVTLDEIIAGIEGVTREDVLRVAGELFTQDTVGVTVLGPAGPAALDFSRLAVA